jgi:hypothetical protein
VEAWRRRVARPSGAAKIVPVELVEDGDSCRGVRLEGAARRGGQLHVVLPQGLCIEKEPGFDGVELRRLIAALEALSQSGRPRPAV